MIYERINRARISQSYAIAKEPRQIPISCPGSRPFISIVFFTHHAMYKAPIAKGAQLAHSQAPGGHLAGTWPALCRPWGGAQLDPSWRSAGLPAGAPSRHWLAHVSTRQRPAWPCRLLARRRFFASTGRLRNHPGATRHPSNGGEY